MIHLLFYSALSVALLALLGLAWRLTAPRRRLPDSSALPRLEELLPVHCRYFPQIRQALSLQDESYLKERAPDRIWRGSSADRKKVAESYLAGLLQDFIRLEQLGRTVAALAPHVSRKDEIERLWLGLRFRVLYRLVWLRLFTGSTPLLQLTRLTQLVGILAKQTESAMAALGEASASRLPSQFSA